MIDNNNFRKNMTPVFFLIAIVILLIVTRNYTPHKMRTEKSEIVFYV